MPVIVLSFTAALLCAGLGGCGGEGQSKMPPVAPSLEQCDGDLCDRQKSRRRDETIHI
jgi:hypothetical protein